MVDPVTSAAPSWRGRAFHTTICRISGISESLGARDISPERAPGGGVRPGRGPARAAPAPVMGAAPLWALFRVAKSKRSGRSELSQDKEPSLRLRLHRLRGGCVRALRA